MIYGTGGLGAGIARTFARERARVFLAGRTREPLEALAADIVAAGWSAEATVLDVLDERAVDEHVRDAVARGQHRRLVQPHVARGQTGHAADRLDRRGLHARLVGSLTEHGLIGECRLWVHPAVVGCGSASSEMGPRTDLRVVDTTTFSSGTLVLAHEPTGGVA